MRYAFKPRLLPTLFSILGVGILLSLGTWQRNRYQEKLAIEALQEERLTAPARTIDSFADKDLDALDYRTLTLTGTLDPSRTILFKHRTYEKRPGFWVAQPLVLSSAREGDEPEAVLVNRGWVPFDKGMEIAKGLASEEDHGTFTGLFHQLPQNIADPKARAKIKRGEMSLAGEISTWDSYDIEAIHGALPYTMPARPAVFVLDASHNGDPFPLSSIDTITKPYMTSERHMGYSVFWYTLGGVLALLWLGGSFGVIGSFRSRQRPPAASEA